MSLQFLRGSRSPVLLTRFSVSPTCARADTSFDSTASMLFRFSTFCCATTAGRWRGVARSVTALSSAANTLSVGVDGRSSKLSPLAGTPEKRLAMPSTSITVPLGLGVKGTLVCAVGAPSRSTEYVTAPVLLLKLML